MDACVSSNTIASMLRKTWPAEVDRIRCMVVRYLRGWGLIELDEKARDGNVWKREDDVNSQDLTMRSGKT